MGLKANSRSPIKLPIKAVRNLPALLTSKIPPALTKLTSSEKSSTASRTSMNNVLNSKRSETQNELSVPASSQIKRTPTALSTERSLPLIKSNPLTTKTSENTQTSKFKVPSKTTLPNSSTRQLSIPPPSNRPSTTEFSSFTNASSRYKTDVKIAGSVKNAPTSTTQHKVGNSLNPPTLNHGINISQSPISKIPFLEVKSPLTVPKPSTVTTPPAQPQRKNWKKDPVPNVLQSKPKRVGITTVNRL